MTDTIDTIVYNGKRLPYIHRDISWLSFNYRVLQEAKDPFVPLFERITFLAIYSSNLSEFFKVRMSNHRNLLRSKAIAHNLDYEPQEVVQQILRILDAQHKEFNQIFEEKILPELEQNKIRILKRLQLSKEQSEYIEKYFQSIILPHVQPVVLLGRKIKYFLNNDALYLAIWMRDKSIKEPHKYTCAYVPIPSDKVSRFLQLPAEEGWTDYIMLDDVIRHNISFMFPGYDIIDSFSMKLTRDAELYIEDEYTGDLVHQIKESLKRRDVGLTSRFVYDRTMPLPIINYLRDVFHLEEYDLLPEGRYHNNFDFFNFPRPNNSSGLVNQSLPPLAYKPLENTKDFFDALQKRDHLLHFPYQSYESVIKLFEQASLDPAVEQIRILQYRVANESRIMDALMNAVAMGKKVTAFIEIQARFDEAANINWGKKLEEAGVKVSYSNNPRIKVHSKMALIKRQESGREQYYAYLSTGNFHEKTAKLYSDFGFFTADTRITNEVLKVFEYLDYKKHDLKFKHLLVGQFNLRSDLEAMIDQEIANAVAGKKGEIIIKLNSLQDRQMIEKLYEASNQGVKIKLIVRGICSLIPGLKGWSENIEAISIVDRFLEHARIYIFYNDGKERVYLSSADWMGRNLKHRVETAFPVYDERLAEEIKDFIAIQLNDNTKARIINHDNSNTYKKGTAGFTIRSQIETYRYLEHK